MCLQCCKATLNNDVQGKPCGKEEGSGCSEMGGSPTGVDGKETLCRRLPFNNDSNTTERKQCHSLLDWLILRCNYQWQLIHEF